MDRFVDEEGIARELARGTPRDRICTLFELMPAGLRQVESRPNFDKKIDYYKERQRALRASQADLIDELTGRSLRVYEEALHSEDKKSQLRAAEAFVKPAVESHHRVQTLPTSFMSTAAAAAALLIGMNEIRTLVNGLPPIEVEATVESLPDTD